jgi:hypothetical protein
VTGIAAAQLAWENFLAGLDRQRADTAGQQVTPVPGLASTTAAGLARRLTPAQCQAVESGLAAVTGRMLSLLPAQRAVARAAGPVTIDLDNRTWKSTAARSTAWPRVVPVDRLYDPGHLAGTPHRRDPGLPDRGHRRDLNQAGSVGLAVGGREAQKLPQHTQFLVDRLDLVSGQRGDERLDRGGVAPGQPAARAGERDKLTSYRPIRPNRRHGAIRRTKPHLEPGDGLGASPG